MKLKSAMFILAVLLLLSLFSAPSADAVSDWYVVAITEYGLDSYGNFDIGAYDTADPPAFFTWLIIRPSDIYYKEKMAVALTAGANKALVRVFIDPSQYPAPVEAIRILNE